MTRQGIELLKIRRWKLARYLEALAADLLAQFGANESGLLVEDGAHTAQRGP